MTDLLARSQTGAAPPRATGPLGRLARASYRRRRLVVACWLLALGAAIGLTAALGGDLANGATLPGSDSEKAQHLLEQRFPDRSGDQLDVVLRADDITAPPVRSAVSDLREEMAVVPHVTQVSDPYTTPGAIAPDGRTLVVRVSLDAANPNDMPVDDTRRLMDAVAAAETDALETAITGGAVQIAEMPSPGGTEAIGLLAAGVILLVVFGSVVAAGLPLGTAIAGLAVSSSLVGLTAAFLDVPDFARILGSMIGIAVGIDYALLMVTRFREWRALGLGPEEAAVATLDTAGRAVLVAGLTVMVSMAGLFAMGMSIMYGTAVVAMTAVLVVMIAALTLFPALLGFGGRAIDRLGLPLLRPRAAEVAADGHLAPAPGWLRWSRFVQRHSVAASVAAVATLLLLAAPFLGASFAIPDAGNDPPDFNGRQGYDMVAGSFGPGYNGPLLVVADLADADGSSSAPYVERLSGALAGTPGVASVAPPVLSPAGDAALLTVVPTTGPQDGATTDLTRDLRDRVIPDALVGSGVQAFVGGRTATELDMNDVLISRLPLLIGGVVGVSFLLLLVAFRSVVVALTAAVMNLLSVAAAYGVTAFFLEGGWAGGLIGIDEPAPIAAYLPMIMFALLFGLSMDYEVFLVSRMREAWVRTRDNDQAVLAGLAGTGRVITAAATIMIAVFAAMVALPNVMMKSFGVGMVAAIVVDATLVRMLLVPAVMQLLGRRNWWLPRALDRRLPQLHVEGRADRFLPAAPEHASS
ncbi:MMPL family transporter [Nocardioides sp. T2.26MG-1]|uniref:MMPL family transporter n=1 Tax=Nocardioides sp. T2.26MG-1 TaxID=3041166 RepID=UPI002477397E|nr:MMPL family transporter [Nocardioides sp. T2.26MG-1]CAI9418661.1 Membrane protein YdfJ [Nocardioides sp. T2.26MG-1]